MPTFPPTSDVFQSAYLQDVAGDEPGGRPAVSPVEMGSVDADVLESGSAPRQWRAPGGAWIVVVVALLVGGLAGYLLGRSGGSAHPRASAPRASSTSATAQPAGAGLGPTSALAPTGQRCSAQHGRILQLGVQIVNSAGTQVVLHRVAALMPLGGLRTVGAGWDTCGALGPVSPPPTLTLPPGGTAWASARLRVLAGCPAPYPVDFRLRFALSGRDYGTTITEFPDLSQVSYTGCVTSR
jgi:hypothetical protein